MDRRKIFHYSVPDGGDSCLVPVPLSSESEGEGAESDSPLLLSPNDQGLPHRKAKRKTGGGVRIWERINVVR